MPIEPEITYLNFDVLPLAATKKTGKINKELVFNKETEFEFSGKIYPIDQKTEDIFLNGIYAPKKLMNPVVIEFEILNDINNKIIINPTKYGWSIINLSNELFSNAIFDGNLNMYYIYNTAEYLMDKGFVENYTNGCFYHKDFIQNIKPTTVINKFNYQKHIYTIYEHIRTTISFKLRNEIDKIINNKYNKNLPKTYRSTNGMQYTFGVEIECKRSYIRKKLLVDLELSVERDGSLNDGEGGPEYITEVLQGDVGVNHLQKIMTALALRSTIDKYCSIHLHLGNINFTTEVISNLYIISQKLENELFAMMPNSRRNNVYCKKLPKLSLKTLSEENNSYTYSKDIFYNEFYRELFILACGSAPNENVNSKTQHPNGPKCGYDKNNIRYSWVNFIHAIFKTRNSVKNKTIEFRLHSATLCFEKVYLWLLICMAIVKYSENIFVKYEDEVTLEQVIKYAFPDKYANILEYIKKRTELFNGTTDAENKEYYKLSNKKIVKKTLKELCA